MEFNFDNDVNIKTTTTPSVKIINNGIIDSNGAVLWIADENAEICRWKKNSAGHYLNTIPYIKTDKVILGRVVVNPRMLILQRSLLLKVVAKIGRILRAWMATERMEVCMLVLKNT
jgi:hypothetical protein